MLARNPSLSVTLPASISYTTLYNAVELDTESQPLTTFITEWGRYMNLRMPQGFVAAGDAYTRRYDDIINDVPRKIKCVDDALLYDHSIKEAFFHTWDYLTLCTNNGIVANSNKFQFCKDTVEFAGLTITPSGITPSTNLYCLPYKTFQFQLTSLVLALGLAWSTRYRGHMPSARLCNRSES